MVSYADNRMGNFVKYKGPDARPRVTVIDGKGVDESGYPILSVIIPTRDAYRGGYFPRLLDQIGQQSFQNFELLVVKGDPRQGRAINTGAAMARGGYIMTLDDDTCIGHRDLFKTLVAVMDDHADVGLAGVPNLVPDNVSWLVKQVMVQVPRRSSQMVREITVSDMAEHPCLIMRKDIFYRVGGENELLPRGLDPYLRQGFREAGYKVVVVPDVYIHHLPPQTPGKLVRQFFRNGYIACYVNKFYPHWVLELTTDHRDLEQLQAGWRQRIVRQAKKLTNAIFDLKFVFLSTQLAYLCGFCWGAVKIKKITDL